MASLGRRKRRVRNIAMALLLLGENAMGLEQPEYTILHTEDDIEYRLYEPYLVSETVVRGAVDYQNAGNEGFRRLFNYISGGNSAGVKIAMTAPVARTPNSEQIAMTSLVQQGESGDGWRVTFMLPAKYTRETAPIPDDERVRIKHVPGRLMAVLRYSGRWTEKNFLVQRSRLSDAVDGASVDRIGGFESAAYDPPYMPPFMRRNEVMVEVSGLPAR